MADARTVKGTVQCGDKALVGVPVTDGTNFAITSKNGSFKLKVDDNADFVYIVTPAGYVADWSSGCPEFYIPANADKFDFKLHKYENDEEYSIIAIADPQAQHEKHFAKFVRNMKDVKKTAEDLDNPIGIILGDICWDSMHMYPDFKEEFHKLDIPVYTVIGNHDYNKDNKGDHLCSAEYRAAFGPENYAFGLGKDYMIVLDNIIYDTQKKYTCEYTAQQLSWLTKLLEIIPSDAELFVAQHAPFVDPDDASKTHFIKGGKKLLKVLGDRKVTFLTGHTHISGNFQISNKVVEHNIAGFCGTWWIAKHCNDGTPAGYKVFEKDDDEMKCYYKSVGHDEDYQVEFFNLGEVSSRPNDIVVNVWDYDAAWKVEWFQDGKAMGQMQRITAISPYFVREINKVYTDRGKKIPAYKLPRPNDHYFAATPSQYAEKVVVRVTGRDGEMWEHKYDMRKDYIDVQAHRGGAGLMPENTLHSMKNAMDMGVNTLEFDLQVSKDGQVVVSHDPYFHSRYSTRPDGTVVEKDDPKEYIYQMNYSEVKKYDVGMKENKVWPGQACLPAYKPLLTELLNFTETYTTEHGISPMRYNIEIKSRVKGDGVIVPEYKEFVDKCVEVLKSFNLGERLVVQCFDLRALEYMHEKYPELILSYLVDKGEGEYEDYMSKLSFTPQWVSPHYSLVNEDMLEKAHADGVRVVPWTVDKQETIDEMIRLHVDAIISNYPNRLLKSTRGYE